MLLSYYVGRVIYMCKITIYSDMLLLYKIFITCL